LIRNKGVARRYAEALVHIMEDSGDYQELDRELSTLLEIIKEHPATLDVVEDPSLARADKRKFIMELTEMLQFSETMKGLLQLLIQKERFGSLPEIAEDYRRQYKRKLGLVQVEVRSVLKLEDAEMERVRQLVKKITGKTAEIQQVQDPEIIAGMVVRIGNTILDGSVRNQFELMRRNLTRRQAG
jgi:F-type H+-transporting ATPase subunit delta